MSRQTIRLTVSLPADLAEKAKETAEKNFQPISKYIAELIWSDLNPKKARKHQPA